MTGIRDYPIVRMRYATEMVSEQKSCRIFPLIKEVRAFVKQVEVTGDHGKGSLQEMIMFISLWLAQPLLKEYDATIASLYKI